MPWQQGVDCYFLQTHQHHLLLILLRRPRAAITAAAPAARGVICYLDCKNPGNKTSSAHFINRMCHPLGLRASLLPIKHQGGHMKYSLPITGCLCLPCRGESCVGGAGAPEGSPPRLEPPLLPSVPPSGPGRRKQLGEAAPAPGRVALAWMGSGSGSGSVPGSATPGS